MKAKLLSPWLTARTQFVLAAVFVVAAAPKILDPPGFAHQVHNYHLAPDGLVNLFALVLPWVELIVGLALFLGVWRRAAAGLAGILLIAFMGALGINLARGRPVDCSCFSTSPVQRSDSERLGDMKLAIARDLGLLLLTAQVFASAREA
jgi:uncharacterized membrane protein YphA (DoxX/SURF4 family)